jgi:hypothetical protein
MTGVFESGMYGSIMVGGDSYISGPRPSPNSPTSFQIAVRFRSTNGDGKQSSLESGHLLLPRFHGQEHGSFCRQEEARLQCHFLNLYNVIFESYRYVRSRAVNYYDYVQVKIWLQRG